MGLKENFNQALREMLGKGGLVGSDLENKAKRQSDLDSFLDVPPSSPGERLDGGSEPPSSFRAAAGAPGGTAGADQPEPPNFEDHTAGRYGYGRYSPPGGGGGFDFDLKPRQAEEMSVISKNTVVVGDIRTLANITIEGNVKGKVDVLKDANLRGILVGDLTCSNSDIRGSSIQGNIRAKGSVYIDNDSLLLGDIAAQYASIDGKVKGNLEIGGKVELHPNAIVAGNINTSTISVADGANIRGYINTTFLREQGDSAFPKQVVLGGDDGAEQQQG